MIVRLAVALILAVCAGCARAPTYLRAYGPRAEHEATLGWVLLVIASIVVLVVAVLVLAAMLRRRGGSAGGPMAPSESGIRWVVVGGIVVPAVILFGVLFMATTTLAVTSSPATVPAFTIQVTGHQWWWEVRYPGTAPGDAFVTANELHIPVGRPVRLELTTADVIHSFWVPQLAGKTDLIPGQRNITWIEADTAGTYWGRCGEYCGLQHANMQLSMIAESPADFERWRKRQLQMAVAPSSESTVKGRDVFTQSACALCHTIRGTDAGGAVGPDLTHLAARRTLAAGTLPNTRGYLAGWIANPQAIKPGTIMPVVPLTSEQLHALTAYLESLE